MQSFPTLNHYLPSTAIKLFFVNRLNSIIPQMSNTSKGSYFLSYYNNVFFLFPPSRNLLDKDTFSKSDPSECCFVQFFFFFCTFMEASIYDIWTCIYCSQCAVMSHLDASDFTVFRHIILKVMAYYSVIYLKARCL